MGRQGKSLKGEKFKEFKIRELRDKVRVKERRRMTMGKFITRFSRCLLELANEIAHTLACVCVCVCVCVSSFLTLQTGTGELFTHIFLTVLQVFSNFFQDFSRC